MTGRNNDYFIHSSGVARPNSMNKIQQFMNKVSVYKDISKLKSLKENFIQTTKNKLKNNKAIDPNHQLFRVV